MEWNMGSLPSGEDSNAVQVFGDTHWPELEILIVVVPRLPR